MKFIRLIAPLAAALLPVILPAQNLKEFEKNVTEFTLSNGLHFIVLERHAAPVVSFHTYVNAGSVDDPKGRTGVAHMFEHVAFKGTPEIGGTNPAAEKLALASVEKAYDALEAEKRKGDKTTEAKVKALSDALDKAMEKAGEYVEPNLYPRIIEENGGVSPGRYPIAVSTALAVPVMRSNTHLSTRLFSPYPGHRKRPSSSRRNQLTKKIFGRFSAVDCLPTLSQWLK